MIDLVSTLILASGFADDLRSRKIHNSLLLGLLFISAILIFTNRGLSGLEYGALWLVLGIALTYPLVLVGGLGAGDTKLFAVFSFTSEPQVIVQVYIYSLIAGVSIGVVRALLGGELPQLLRQTAAVAVNGKSASDGRFNIPFSAALLLGWLAYWTMNGAGGLL